MSPQYVHLFVFDGLSDWEASYAIAGINNPLFQQNPGRYRVLTVAPVPGPVLTMGGLRVTPDLTLDALRPADSAMLILPGGVAWEEGKHDKAIELAREFLDAGVPVAAICGATLALARAGFLDERRHTSNMRAYLAATQYRGAALYEDTPAVTDRGLITASGIAPLEFAVHIFRCLGLYKPAVVEAWYNLFKTASPEHYAALLQATNVKP